MLAFENSAAILRASLGYSCRLAEGFLVRSLAVFVLILSLVLPAAPSVSEEGEQLRFTFAPADGEHWVEVMEDTREYDYSGDYPSAKQETTQTDELIFQHTEDGGYLLTRVLGPASMRLNGAAYENTILDSSEGSRLELTLDGNGRAIGVQGYRSLMRKLERSLNPEEWAKLQNTYSVAQAERSELARWNDRLAGLVGAEMTDGNKLGYMDQYPTGAGNVLIHGTLSFEGYTEISGQRGYMVRYEFGSGEKAPSLEGLEPVLDFRDRRAGEAAAVDFEFEGTRVRVFVPESGLLIYENTEVHWLQPGTHGVPDIETSLQTVYRLKPAS